VQHQIGAGERGNTMSIAALVADLGQSAVDQLRDEVLLARREIADAIGKVRRGLVLLLIAPLLGIVALFTLARAATAALTRHMGEPEAALFVGLALVSAAGLAAWIGLRRLG
jgi:hypothetical protein